MAKEKSVMICCNCGSPQPVATKKCTNCGSPNICYEDDVTECSDCGKMNPPDSEKCIHCDEKFEPSKDDEEESNEDESNEDDDLVTLNKWVEYREWVFFWGLFLDSEEMLNKLLRNENKKGWKCIQVWRAAGIIPNIPIVTMLFAVLVGLVTLGFVQYYVGPALLMERVDKK